MRIIKCLSTKCDVITIFNRDPFESQPEVITFCNLSISISAFSFNPWRNACNLYPPKSIHVVEVHFRDPLGQYCFQDFSMKKYNHNPGLFALHRSSTWKDHHFSSSPVCSSAGETTSWRSRKTCCMEPRTISSPPPPCPGATQRWWWWHWRWSWWSCSLLIAYYCSLFFAQGQTTPGKDIGFEEEMEELHLSRLTILSFESFLPPLSP